MLHTHRTQSIDLHCKSIHRFTSQFTNQIKWFLYECNLGLILEISEKSIFVFSENLKSILHGKGKKKCLKMNSVIKICYLRKAYTTKNCV